LIESSNKSVTNLELHLDTTAAGTFATMRWQLPIELEDAVLMITAVLVLAVAITLTFF
jgi:hypothetical protein